MENNLGGAICQYRQLRKLTQNEFALRLGVTPQAVSKWECGNGLPDISLLEGICKILNVTPNALLNFHDAVVENGNSSAANEIRNNMFAEPLLLDFGADVIPYVIAGLETDYINTKRKELAKEFGILMPIIRLRDNIELGKQDYRIMSYDKLICNGSINDLKTEVFQKMIDKIVFYCRSDYANILNKQLVKSIIDNVKEQYPGVADDFIPERVSYLAFERKLQEKLAKGESIRDIIHIIENMEEQL